MAGEKAAWAGEGMLSWGGFWAPYARRLLTPWRPSVGLALSLFLLTLLAFHFTSQGHTPFNNPVRLADAVLRGGLDIANGADPRVQHERIPGLTVGEVIGLLSRTASSKRRRITEVKLEGL